MNVRHQPLTLEQVSEQWDHCNGLQLRKFWSLLWPNKLWKYGRPVAVVATLEDLVPVRPGDRVLYKFHGSLEHPETLVFTESQYKARINDAEHFMNIRLRSDLLAKSFFFIGYSFRDQNIKALFLEMAQRFPRALPGSFLVAYQWSQELDDLCRQHGVECIDPASHIPSPTKPAENLERFLNQLCESTLGLSNATQLHDLFTPKTPIPKRIAISGQIDGISKLTFNSDVGSALAAFRGACDGATIPESLVTKVSEAFVEIVRKATPEHEGDLHGGLFNLKLPIHAVFDPVSAFLAFANRLPHHGLSIHMPPGKIWPRELLPLAAGRAIELLKSWNEPITDNFYAKTSQWFDKYWNDLPDDMKSYVRPLVAEAWRQRHTIYEQPIHRAERLGRGSRGSLLDTPSFRSIHEHLTKSLPQRFPTPPEG